MRKDFTSLKPLQNILLYIKKIYAKNEFYTGMFNKWCACAPIEICIFL